MDTILEAIMTRLSDKIPALRFIDIDLEQLQLTEPPIDFPCALIDVAQITYSSCAPGRQIANATINVTLGFSLLGTSDTHATPTDRARAMEHYQIIGQVAEALHGYSNGCFKPLVRENLSRRATTYPRHYTLSFVTQFTEIFE